MLSRRRFLVTTASRLAVIFAGFSATCTSALALFARERGGTHDIVVRDRWFLKPTDLD